MNKMYHYFVSYMFTQVTHQGFGNAEVFTSQPIHEPGVIHDMQRDLCMQGKFDNLTILYWKRFEDAEGTNV